MIYGTFAIYPTVDMENAAQHAIVFCDDIEVAKKLCEVCSRLTNTPHSAILRMSSWPDPRLIHNLNGCGENISFSVRDPKAAAEVSSLIRSVLRLEE